jgi:RNA ligase (TIGR02306 family)
MKLASIETVVSSVPHPAADSLDIIKVLGWQCVTKRGQFSDGQRVVFIPIDTLLPDAPWSAFLKKGDKPIRLRTIKLRGEYSQGLVLPVDVLPEGVQGWNIGADVGGELGVKKYEKEVPAQLSGEAAGAFPQYLAAKTDEDNGLSNLNLVEQVLLTQVQQALHITQKLDGSSCTIIVKDGVIEHVCSRNVDLKESEANAFWRAARRAVIAGFHEFTGIVQGELMGPGIQGNQLGLEQPNLFVFQINTRGRWLESNESIAHSIWMGFSHVPTISTQKHFTHTLESLQELADAQVLPDGKPAEGIVVRPGYVPASGIGRPLGFKLINRNYKDL